MTPHSEVPLDSGSIEEQNPETVRRFSIEPSLQAKGLMAVNGGDVLAIQLTHLDGVAVLAVRGEVDADTAPRFRESVERALELGVPVVLDMAQVTFMDSSGITALLGACGATSSGLPNPVQIQRPSDQVRRVLSVTGLDKVFPVKD